jgi:feruloyl esterase
MKTRLILSCVVLAGFALATSAHAADAPGRQACEALRTVSTTNFNVETAEWVAASRMPAGAPGAGVDVPDHCLFRVVLGARPSGIEDLRYGTGVEIRLPAAWNGRMLFQGGGGLDGVLNPALGAVAGHPAALARGFAVVSSDGGHRGRSAVDGRFGIDQQARLDFAYQAVERSTREAKSLLARYYGRKPEFAYYVGCSTGGREAMLAAQRLPLEFDGVVAGNPSYNLTRVVVNQVYSLQAITRIAPKGVDGRPQMFKAYTETQLRAVADAALRQCDALDGLRDGMINDYKACRFDPGTLVCGRKGAPGADSCLTAAQASTLKSVQGGARDSRGTPLYGDFPFDTGIAGSAWRGMHLGTPTAEPANATLGRDTLRHYVLTPAAPDFDARKFDFDHDMARTTETAAINDAVATLHDAFAGHGGKLIVYHGLSDQAMSTGVLTQWYEHITPRDAAGPQDWARLFLIPGMTHCGGGQSTDQFDMLSAIQGWVEEKRTPDRVIASGRAFPGVTRPLCPYPAVARYQGGDVNDEHSFACR